MEAIIEETNSTVSGAGTEFITTDRGFWLYGSKFTGLQERATVMGIGASGEWEEKTNKDGEIFVGAAPNVLFVDLPAGTYRIKKTATALKASVSFSNVL